MTTAHENFYIIDHYDHYPQHLQHHDGLVVALAKNTTAPFAATVFTA